MSPQPESTRPLSEWAARWIVWLLAVGATAVLSASISLLAAHAVLLGLAKVGIRLDGKTEVFYGFLLASMAAPIPVLLVSQALAPAGRLIATAAVCAAGMLIFGWPRLGQGWASIFLWLVAWTPSWVTLVFLYRKNRRRLAATHS